MYCSQISEARCSSPDVRQFRVNGKSRQLYIGNLYADQKWVTDEKSACSISSKCLSWTVETFQVTQWLTEAIASSPLIYRRLVTVESNLWEPGVGKSYVFFTVVSCQSTLHESSCSSEVIAVEVGEDRRQQIPRLILKAMNDICTKTFQRYLKVCWKWQ